MNKYFHAFAAILFFVLAAIQFNDPDPFYWIVVYLATSAVAGAMFFGKKQATFTIVVIGMVLAGLLVSASGTFEYFKTGDFASILGEMDGEKSYIESAREFGGLLIAAIYLTVARVMSKSS